MYYQDLRRTLIHVPLRSLLQMLQHSSLRARRISILQARYSDRAADGFIGDQHKTAAARFFYRHLGNDRYAHTCGDHCQDCCKLSALEYYIGIYLRLAASLQRILTEAVPFFQEKKRLIANMVEHHRAAF